MTEQHGVVSRPCVLRPTPTDCILASRVEVDASVRTISAAPSHEASASPRAVVRPLAACPPDPAYIVSAPACLRVSLSATGVHAKLRGSVPSLPPDTSRSSLAQSVVLSRGPVAALAPIEIISHTRTSFPGSSPGDVGCLHRFAVSRRKTTCDVRCDTRGVSCAVAPLAGETDLPISARQFRQMLHGRITRVDGRWLPVESVKHGGLPLGSAGL